MAFSLKWINPVFLYYFFAQIKKIKIKKVPVPFLLTLEKLMPFRDFLNI